MKENYRYHIEEEEYYSMVEQITRDFDEYLEYKKKKQKNKKIKGNNKC